MLSYNIVIKFLYFVTGRDTIANHIADFSGGEGFDKIFTEKLSRGSSASSIVLNPSSSTTDGSGNLNLESTLTSLDEMVWKAKATCTALTSSLENPEASLENLCNVKQLNQKLESMQKLLMQLRTQI